MKSFALTAFALTFGAVSVLAFPLAAREAEEEAKFPEISEEHIEHLEDLTGDKTPSHYEISIRKGDDKVLICADGECNEVDLDEACEDAPVDSNGECVYLHNHIDLQYGDKSAEGGDAADEVPEVTPEQLESLKAFSTIQPTHYEISIKGPDDTVFICKDGDCEEFTMEEACADAQKDEDGVCVWEHNHISLEYGDEPVDAPAEGEDEEPAEGEEEEPAEGEEEETAEEEQPEEETAEEEQPEEDSAEEEQPEEESAEEEQPEEESAEEEQPEEESAEVEEPEEGAEEEQPAEEEGADKEAEEGAEEEGAEEEQPAEEDADKEVEEGAEEPEEEAEEEVQA